MADPPLDPEMQQVQPPSHALLAAELAVSGSVMCLSGVAAAAVAINPSGFVNQASGNMARSVIQSTKNTSIQQCSFVPSVVSVALKSTSALRDIGTIPQAASVPKIQNEKAASKIHVNIKCLEASEGGGTLWEFFWTYINRHSLRMIMRIHTLNSTDWPRC
jgi:hypothetical protein